MNYRLWIFSNNTKIYEIKKHCTSGVELGMKSDDMHQMKFTLNSRNLDITKYLISNQNAQVLLEIEGSRYIFYVAKYELSGRSNYNVNLVILANYIKYEINPLQNQTYNGSLNALISQLLPIWQINQINGLDAIVSISIGTDDKWATIKKAVEQAGWRMRISGYSKTFVPILEYGNAQLLPAILQLSNTTIISSFGSKNRIQNLTAQISNEYTSSIVATGKYDSGSLPEFNLVGYIGNDANYPIILGSVTDQSLVNNYQKSSVKKYTIPATITILADAKAYLYQTARADLIDINAGLTSYTIEANLTQFVKPLDKVFLFYNKSIKNLSGTSVDRLSDTKIIAGIQYSLDTGKVGISLSPNGKYAGSAGSRNILALNKSIKSLTQST